MVRWGKLGRQLDRSIGDRAGQGRGEVRRGCGGAILGWSGPVWSGRSGAGAGWCWVVSLGGWWGGVGHAKAYSQVKVRVALARVGCGPHACLRRNSRHRRLPTAASLPAAQTSSARAQPPAFEARCFQSRCRAPVGARRVAKAEDRVGRRYGWGDVDC